jgi:hypothetical protein
MPRPKVVKGAFFAVEIARHPILLPEGMEMVVATRNELMGIGLVADIPDHLIAIQIQRLIECSGQFDDPKARAEVSTAGCHRFQMLITNLMGNLL